MSDCTDGDDLIHDLDYLADDSLLYSPPDFKNSAETIGLDLGDDLSNQGETYDGLNLGQPLRDQDRYLPIAVISKIMKKHVPKGGKIAKDAKECIQECVSEFISFITSEAGDVCAADKRKTINGEDILKAMAILGFDNYLEPLKIYLQTIREASKGDKSVEVEELPDVVSLADVTNFSNFFEQNSESDPILFYQDPTQHFHFM